MLLLSCDGLTRGFAAGPLFTDLSFELHHGDRIGLVGPNGSGKTTLLRLLAELDRPDSGEVRLHAGARVALLEQQPRFTPGLSLLEEARSALDALILAHQEMVQTSEELAVAVDPAARARLAARYERLNELLRHHDAYNIDHHVEAVLDGLGFAADDYDRPVETFSGGQKNRLMLAKLLLASPDVMLLDEPSNHLDIKATQWLEDYLGKQNEAMLIVSHDRCFLDRIVNKVFELNARKLTVFVGNYTAYARQRQERYQLALKTWQAQQEYIEKQEEYIRRAHYGQLHRQAQSRRAQLERLERLERPTLIEGPHMHFRSLRRSGDIVFEAVSISKAYDKPLFAGLSFQLPRGRRLGILGPNGSGKTTLLRILLGLEQPDSGEVRRGSQIDVGYFDQNLAFADADQEVIRAVWPDDPDVDEQALRNLLGRFGITGEMVYQKVGSLSGGERSRVALARLVAGNVNLLVLDEPTNHLDLWACEALENALQAFPGTVIVVSHDRWFLNRVVDMLLVLGNGQAAFFYGNYELYEHMVRSTAATDDTRRVPLQRLPAAASPSPVAEKNNKRKRRFPYRKVEELEADIAAVENEVARLEAQLGSPGLYRDGDKVRQTTQAFHEAKARLAALYEHWEEAVELNNR